MGRLTSILQRLRRQPQETPPSPQTEPVIIPVEATRPRTLEVIRNNPLCTLEDILNATGKAEPATKAWLRMYRQKGKVVAVKYSEEDEIRYATKKWFEELRSKRVHNGVVVVQ